MGLRDLCQQVHQVYREDNLPKAQKEMYTVLPEMALRPADAYDRLVRGQVESVEIDDLMGRTLAVMIVPYPPGIPLIMPGERITSATSSIQEYMLYARDFDQRFPGFETDIHGLRFEAGKRRTTLPRGLRQGGDRPMIPRDVKAPTVAIPFHRLLKVVAIVDAENPQTRQLIEHITAENVEVEVTGSFDRDVTEDSSVGAYIAMVDGDRLELARSLVRSVRDSGFSTPLWALADSHRISDMAVLGLTGEVDGYIYLGQQTPAFYAKQVVASLVKYGRSLLPPFFGGLMAYDGEGNIAFACPGHQGGQFYRKSPAGQLFFKHFGESVFRNDLCNADVDLGDLLIHEGPAAEAQKYAAKVFGADKTYFVLNGTSTSNKVVTNAVLKSGDLVLFDRNNHKSLHQGALVQAGAIPVFLPTSRNPFGMIGAVDWDAWDEAYLREQIRANPLVEDPQRHRAERPFRLACIQLATYDGTVYNVRKVLEKIGHLCDYVLWDEAWIGYNAFHPLFEDHSPMRIETLAPEQPGLFSTQSVHKQGAGFSQASQIHKRDEHIRGQRRYVEHKRFNELFLMNASTSPFYPLVRLARRERKNSRGQGR